MKRLVKLISKHFIAFDECFLNRYLGIGTKLIGGFLNLKDYIVNLGIWGTKLLDVYYLKYWNADSYCYNFVNLL